MDIDIGKLILENSVLIINIISVEVGLLIGIWFRSSFIDNSLTFGENARNFAMFTIALIYGACVSTFSNWPIVAVEFAIIGVVSVPLSVPFYKLLLQAAPNLIKKLVPEWLLKLILEQPKDVTPGNDNKGEIK
jgi:hypothetical protein